MDDMGGMSRRARRRKIGRRVRKRRPRVAKSRARTRQRYKDMDVVEMNVMCSGALKDSQGMVRMMRRMRMYDVRLEVRIVKKKYRRKPRDKSRAARIQRKKMRQRKRMKRVKRKGRVRKSRRGRQGMRGGGMTRRRKRRGKKKRRDDDDMGGMGDDDGMGGMSGDDSSSSSDGMGGMSGDDDMMGGMSDTVMSSATSSSSSSDEMGWSSGDDDQMGTAAGLDDGFGGMGYGLHWDPGHEYDFGEDEPPYDKMGGKDDGLGEYGGEERRKHFEMDEETRALAEEDVAKNEASKEDRRLALQAAREQERLAAMAARLPEVEAELDAMREAQEKALLEQARQFEAQTRRYEAEADEEKEEAEAEADAAKAEADAAKAQLADLQKQLEAALEEAQKAKAAAAASEGRAVEAFLQSQEYEGKIALAEAEASDAKDAGREALNQLKSMMEEAAIRAIDYHGVPTVIDHPACDPYQDAGVLRAAMKGLGTKEDPIIDILGTRSNRQRQLIKEAYKKKFKRTLVKDLESELTFNLEELVLALMRTPENFDAWTLYHAMKGLGTADKTLIEVLCTRSNEQIKAAISEFERVYKKDFRNYVEDDTSGDYCKLLLELSKGERDESPDVDWDLARSESKALHEAGVDKVFGTNEQRFIEIMTQRSYQQLRATFHEYDKISDYGIETSIEKEMSGNLEKGLLCIAHAVRSPGAYFAGRIHEAVKGAGTNDSKLIRIVVSRCEQDLKTVGEVYSKTKKYGRTFQSVIRDDTSGDYRKLLTLLYMSG